MRSRSSPSRRAFAPATSAITPACRSASSPTRTQSTCTPRTSSSCAANSAGSGRPRPSTRLQSCARTGRASPMSSLTLTGLEWLATAVVLLDRALRVKYLNPAAEALFATGRKTVLDQPFPGLFVDSGSLAGLLHQALREERGFAAQDLTRALPGWEPLHLDCLVTPVELEAAALLLELRPIEQRLRIEREEQRMTQHRANRELTRNLAHEIKNPLGGL